MARNHAPPRQSQLPPIAEPAMRRSAVLLFLLCLHAAPGFAPRAAAAPAPKPGSRVLGIALEAVACAHAQGLPQGQRLALIDYRLPANLPRLWVYDLVSGSVLFHERVAHGRGTGELMATRFSNDTDTHASSLGLFLTEQTYDGANGYSLRLRGLEPGINDRAMERQIVMHGADYVSDAFIRMAGRLGRSFGCPAVRREVAQPMIDSLKGGQYVLAYYPDAQWLKTSRYLGCAKRVPVVPTRARSGTAAAD